MDTPPILNVGDVDFMPWGDGGKYEAKLGSIGRRIGAKKLGYQVVVLAPGKAGWPRHAHFVNEEMFLILEGSGTLRYADAKYPVKAGDVICCPAGETTPHQIVNTSDAELRYLALSTMMDPEVVDYPDTGNVGVMARDPHDPANVTIHLYKKEAAVVDRSKMGSPTARYWDDA